MTMTIFDQITIRRIDGHQYAIDITYVPNDWIGPVTKTIGEYYSLHEVWMAVKEIFNKELEGE